MVKAYCGIGWMVIMLLSLSCVKDRPNPDVVSLPNTSHRGMLIGNEGAYGNNNAELAFLDLETNTMHNQLFHLANGKELGDVLQSITFIDGKYYLCINGSHVVWVIDPFSYHAITRIEGVQSPRYICAVGPHKAYVSSLYFPRLYVIDLEKQLLTKTIVLNHNNTENLLLYKNKVYVTNWDTSSHFVYVVDPLLDSVQKQIELPGKASHDLVMDAENRLWILSGNAYKKTSATLSCYLPDADSLQQVFYFDAGIDPIRLSTNPTQDTLYFIHADFQGSTAKGGLYKMGIHETSLPLSPFIAAFPNTYFWAMGIDPLSHDIFLADPKGFTQQGTIYQFTQSGVLKHSFQTGIGPNCFLYKP